MNPGLTAILGVLIGGAAVIAGVAIGITVIDAVRGTGGRARVATPRVWLATRRHTELADQGPVTVTVTPNGPRRYTARFTNRANPAWGNGNTIGDAVAELAQRARQGSGLAPRR